VVRNRGRRLRRKTDLRFLRVLREKSFRGKCLAKEAKGAKRELGGVGLRRETKKHNVADGPSTAGRISIHGGDQCPEFLVEWRVAEYAKKLGLIGCERRSVETRKLLPSFQGQTQCIDEGLLREFRLIQLLVTATRLLVQSGVHENFVMRDFRILAVGQHRGVLVGCELEELDGFHPEQAFTCSHDGLKSFLRSILFALPDDAREQLRHLLDQTEDIVALHGERG
jgi:hypothetical protein